MKGFLNKILLFFLILFIVVSGTFGITFMLSYKNVSDISLDEDIQIIICGDSHTKTALNDSIIPHSLNIAHSSEHYLYTYNVLKVLLKNNPQITTVILGFSYHNISSFYDDNIFEQDKTQYMYPRYFTVLDLNTISLLMHHNFDGFLTDIKDIYHGVYRHINAKELDDFSFIGWFYQSHRNNKNDSTVNRALQEHYYRKDHSMLGLSAFQLVYLDRIVELCQKKDVRLLLVNCPVSREYRIRVPQKFVDGYDEFARKYDRLVFDYHEFPVPERCYGDGDHLNISGSEIFSVHLLDEMKFR